MVTTRLHTIEELWKLVSEDDNFELIEGELIEASPGKRRHGLVQVSIISLIHVYVKTRGLGIVSTEEGFILHQNPDTVLAPDVAFVRNARLGNEPQTWSDVAPDLAVEVVSPTSTRAEIDRKVRIYLKNGVRAVWVMYPERREVLVHTPGQSAHLVAGEAQLEGGDVLPGFSVSLQEIFGQ